MKYEKAMVTIIELTEDIVTASWCSTQNSYYADCDNEGSRLSASCTQGNHIEKGQCDTNGHHNAVYH